LIPISPKISDNFFTSEKLATDKENLLPNLENQLKFYHQQLIASPTRENKRLIEKLIKVIQMVTANVDPKSALDYFFLS
jgi:hypothetical protein